MRRSALAIVMMLCGSAHAWELETHVGLTQRAARGSQLDAWLRARGLAEGLYSTLSVHPGAHADVTRVDDRDLLHELGNLDPGLGVTPDGSRQPAIAWLLAGSALEGARIDRIVNHFVDPKTHGGLSQQDVGPSPTRLSAVLEGLGTMRGAIAGSNYDGTGMRADRWVAAPAAKNPMSRARFLDELYTAAAGPTEDERSAALARALVCAGSIANVLESVGDPANARGDFVVNTTVAGAPFAKWADERYGLFVPAPDAARRPRATLGAFFTNGEGTGLADETARDFVSPGTLPGTDGALPSPKLPIGREPTGSIVGPRVRELATWQRTSDGVRFAIPPAAVHEAVDVLLPQIASETAALLDFLFANDLVLVENTADGSLDIRVGDKAFGPGELELLVERPGGHRDRLLLRQTSGGQAGATLATLDHDTLTTGAASGATKIVAVYRGATNDGEPVVYSVAR